MYVSLKKTLDQLWTIEKEYRVNFKPFGKIVEDLSLQNRTYQPVILWLLVTAFYYYRWRYHYCNTEIGHLLYDDMLDKLGENITADN